MNLNFSKVRNVKTPNRAHTHDAGTDFFVPEKDAISNEEFYKEKNIGILTIDDGYLIPPGRGILIPSGIKVDVPTGYALIAYDKSGIAAKKGLIVGSKVVDCGYQGEVHISLINTTGRDQVVKFGEKVVQFILLHTPLVSFVEMNIIDLYGTESTRKDGGFGSTGLK